MSAAAWRVVGYAGLIAAGLWLAHATAGVAAAQPDDDANDRGSTRSTQAVDSRRDSSPVRFGAGRSPAGTGSTPTSDRPATSVGAGGDDRPGGTRVGSRARSGIDIGSNGVTVRLGAHQVRISSGDTDVPSWGVRRSSGNTALPDAAATGAASIGAASAGAGSAGSTGSGEVPSALGRGATLYLSVPQVVRNRGGASPLSRQAVVNTVRIQVSSGATVRGGPESESLAVIPPEPEPEPDVQPGAHSEPAPEPAPMPRPGAGERPAVIEGRPGLGAAPMPGLGGAPPAAPPPAAPPDLPIGETPPDEPPVIDVGGPVVGGGRGADPSAGAPRPIQAPVLPAPRAVLPPVSVRPLLPVAPPAAPVPPAAAPPVPPVTVGIPARPVPGAGTPTSAGGTAGAPNTAPARGATPGVPGQVAPGAARAEVHRLGYPQYLRSARGAEIAAVALPGAAGLVLLTIGGAFIGYRQANAGRMVRVNSAQRFLP
ncbi:hypothetical protein [Mycolicibacterium thermoresistibile]